MMFSDTKIWEKQNKCEIWPWKSLKYLFVLYTDRSQLTLQEYGCEREMCRPSWNKSIGQIVPGANQLLLQMDF